MKSILQTLVIVCASTVLLTSCGHGGHGGHGKDHGGKTCGCTPDQQAACKCDHKTEAASKDGKKAECEDCKKGS